MWNQRLFQLHQDAKYIDVLEQILYNGFADGVSLKGDRFFYQNPLRSFGNYERFEWIDVPCCPPNVVRLMASLGSYVYAQSSDSVYVNLFVGSKAKISLPSGNTVAIQQETRYPWEGAVSIRLNPERAEAFTMQVRIPGWARNGVVPGDLYEYADKVEEKPALKVNGKPIEFTMERGYARIERKWAKGDMVQLHLPMPVRRVKANAQVQEDRDMVALQRGPLVYCAEWPDNNGHALNLIVPENAKFESQWRPELLNGVQVVTGSVEALQREDNSSELKQQPHQLVAIPYFAWSNRGPGRWQFGCPVSRIKHGSRLCLPIPYMRFAPRVEFKKYGRATTIRTMTSALSMTAKIHSAPPTSLICISECGPSPEPQHGLNTNSNRRPRCLLRKSIGSTTGDSAAYPRPGASFIRMGMTGSQS